MSELQQLPKKRTSPPPSTTTKKPKPPPLSPETTFDDDGNDDSVALISNLLDFSSSPPKTTPFPPSKVKFVPYPYLPPSSPFQSCTSYITINGNEETCGSSFSDTLSSVMASVDTCGSHISDISDSFGFLRVGNNDIVFGSAEMMKSREEQEDDVWDWGELLGEEGEGKH